MVLRRLSVALLFLIPTLGGCYSKATGYGGKFTLAYASGVDVENFVKPIAPGAKLEVHAWKNGTEDELIITGAKSSKPNIVAVDSIRERSVILKGGQTGTAEIEVTAKDDAGNVLVDKMFFHVAKPATHGIEHSCTEEAEAAYVRGENIDIFHSLMTTDRRAVIGFEYAPFKVEPAGALELVAQPQGSSIYRLRAPAANPRVSIRSTVDDKVLTMRVVDRSELQEATLLFSDKILENQTHYAFARVRLGETILCNQTALTKARSLTPDICKVTATLDEDPNKDSNREQLAVITGLKFGICKYEVTLPELAGGRGLVLKGEAKVGRLQFPGEGGGTTKTALAEWRAWTVPATIAVGARDGVAAVVWFGWVLRRRRRRANVNP
jgi:hypothetical protein